MRDEKRLAVPTMFVQFVVILFFVISAHHLAALPSISAWRESRWQAASLHQLGNPNCTRVSMFARPMGLKGVGIKILFSMDITRGRIFCA